MNAGSHGLQRISGQRLRAGRIEVTVTRPSRREFDGAIAASRSLHIDVDPAALWVKVPA